MVACFRSLLDIPIILEPLRQHLRASLEEMLSPLPKTVADRMLSVIVDPVGWC